MRSHAINNGHQCEASSGNATRCDSKVWRAHGKRSQLFDDAIKTCFIDKACGRGLTKQGYAIPGALIRYES
jgi:hypothetical protein